MAMDRSRPMIWVLAVAASACRFGSPPLGGDAAGPPDAPADALDAPIDGPRMDWWNTAWTRRRPITIDTSKLTGPVTNFPLLVQIPQQLVDLNGNRSNALRFVTADNTAALPYELDTLDPGTTSFVWVRLPGTTSAAAPSTLWLYYDNTAALSESAGAGVFADLYVSVHHLGASGPGGVLPDSTGNNHAASPSGGGGGPQLVNIGRIGRARDLDGNDDYYQLAGETDYDFTTTLTVSAWIQRQQFDEVYQAIVCKGDDTWRMHRENTTPFAGFGTTSGGSGNNDNLQGTTNIDNTNWHHIAIVFGGGVKRLYVNGQQDVMANEGPIDTDDTPVQIGHNSNAQTSPDRFWNGNIDEVRISTAERDAAWIFAEHLTVNDPTFVSIGSEERYAP